MSDAPVLATVVTARRTPFGAVHGLLSGWHPADLLAHALTVTLDDAGIAPSAVETVLVGCAHPVGAQSTNLGRAALLAAGWPDDIPATTIERGAGSSHRALQLGAHSIAAGSAEVVVVAGVEVMSLVPAGAPGLNRQYGAIWGSGPAQRYSGGGGLVPVGVAGDRLATREAIDRSVQDDEAARCRQRARLVEHPPWLVVTPTRLNDHDQPRAGLTVMVDDEVPTVPVAADSEPIHDPDGSVAASNTAPHADGAAVAVLASPDHSVASHVEAPVAIAATAEAAVDPVTMFGGGATAGRRALLGAGLSPHDLVAVELDAPHAVAGLELAAGLGVEPSIVNTTGGGLGRGRPLGAIGLGMVAELIGHRRHAETALGPTLVVDENDDGTATATVLIAASG